MCPDKQWFLDTFRANIQPSEDVHKGDDISPEDWAMQMDAQVSRYAGKPVDTSLTPIEPTPTPDETSVSFAAGL